MASSEAEPAIYELAPDQFGTVAGLYRQVWFDRAQIDSALERRQQSRVFVDHLPHPRAALICHGYDYYPAGDPDSPLLRRFIADAPAEAGVFATFYGYCPAGPGWEEALLSDYAGNLERIVRRTFLYRSDTAPPVELPPGATLHVLDALLARRVDAELDEHITLTWGSYEAFAAEGLGCCILSGDCVASAAFPAAVSSRHADVSVATAPELRRHGLAQAVCAALIGRCLARGLVVAWDTNDDNGPSIALARRLGFVEQPPFVELAVPGRQPLTLTNGRWQASNADVDGWPGATAWTRQP